MGVGKEELCKKGEGEEGRVEEDAGRWLEERVLITEKRRADGNGEMEKNLDNE